MAEKISVIVPAYNAGKQLERCVNSIEAQTYPDVEVIIVDDGSKDNTGDVIRALQEKYGNIVTVNTGDRDICVTRNAGLSLVTGKYFAFVDADDYVRPELLEVLHAVLKESQADVAGCSFYSWTEETGPDAEGADNLSKHPAVKYTPEAYLREQVFGKNNSRCWSKLYRREAVGDLDFDEETLVGEDLLFLVKLLGRGAGRRDAASLLQTIYDADRLLGKSARGGREDRRGDCSVRDERPSHGDHADGRQTCGA